MNLSKSLRRELEGLTVNAEVKSDNTRTDIQIEAANRHLGNRLKCVIEAKPCEKSPEKVIHDQLIPKYLTKNDGSTGIVLVLWFCRGPKLCKACANQASLIAKIDQEANDCPRTVSVVHYNIH